MPLQATSGAASYDAFGGGVPVTPVYIEDVMSVWLYTGNGSTQTITNGIDLAGEGGMVWLKTRNAVGTHRLYDTQRGVNSQLRLPSTDAADNISGSGVFDSFNANGFTLGANGANQPGETYASWSFAKAPKFFDVVTYTGNGSNRTIAHNLGSVPGCIIVKRTDTTGDWQVYHRSLSNTQYTVLNTTAAVATGATRWNSTTPTSTEFSLGTDATVNANGGTYVAYLFAHNAGGFGLSGEDNVISCGSYTIDSSGNATIDLGYEPQWVILKHTSATSNWTMLDTMRGWTNSSAYEPFLQANTSNAENSSVNDFGHPTATGFQINNFASGRTGIYIAIRRGPMKVPESGTSVFEPVTTTSSANPLTVTTGFPVDLTIQRWTANGYDSSVLDRLRGGSRTSYASLLTTSPAAEVTGTGAGIGFDSNTTEVDSGWISGTANKKIYWQFRRAPGTFDEVCYTGTGSPMLINHNLGVPPELIITKRRNATSTIGWIVSSLYWFASTPWDRNGRLNQDGSLGGGGVYIPASSHSATQYPVDGAIPDINASSGTYVAYLWATNPGVTKVGIYTGNGSSQTINCGFTSGARFVMIKAASTTGNWLVADSARGIVAGNDPALYLNSAAAEITGFDWIDADSTGFVVNETATIAANTNGVQYIFLSYS